ncbi:hypothetical protein EMMF5_005326 [Cystobasidiomycetes sp. EMM_F5]
MSAGFVPDHHKQTVSSEPLGEIFRDVNKKPDYDNQGEPDNEIDRFDEQEDIEFGNRGRRERVQREPSGATSARSGSVSRSRDRSVASTGIAGYTETPQQSTNEARNASLSPTRAMGARSVSRGRDSSADTRMRTRLDTLEGIGSSISPVVAHDALDGSTGIRGRQSRSPAPGENSGRVSSMSPSRAMGARSTFTAQ